MASRIDIGINADDRAAIAGNLSRVLADGYTLYLKTHNRALGHAAPGSYAQYAKLSSIKEETGVPDATAMIRRRIF